jgi:hypothetical protein
MTKYYLYNDQLLTWEQVHNKGYTKYPTTQIDIKSIAQWGGIEDLGLMDLGADGYTNPLHGSYWINDGDRWYSLNELAQAGFYPSIAYDSYVVNNGEIQCYAASIEDEYITPYYLIEKAPELGWLDAPDMNENGWVIGELPDQNKTFYVLDAVTGEELNSTKGVVDHLVCDRYNILEDGGVQHIDAPDNSIEIFLGIVYVASSGEFSSRTFSANDYWGSAILDQSDKDTLEDFGVSILPFSEDVAYGPNGSISASNMSSFSFEVLGLYSGMRTGELVADLSNFSAEPKAGTSWNDRVCICSVNAYNQNVMTWKCRITKN